MNRQVVSAIALAVAALSAGQALAQDATPKTREQVRAELLEAQRSGDIIVNSETGQTAREMFPGLYAERAVAAGKTRAEVKAELAEAIRKGDLMADGETGRKLNELFPGRYPAKAAN